MAVLFLAVAVVYMVIGHILKVKRWGLLISVYEVPSGSNLLNAMTLGHTLNAILPFRIGDMVRILWSGKEMKNGCSFACATVIADLYIDVITVGAMFLGLSLTGKGGERLLKISHFYMMVFLIVIPLTVFCLLFRKWIKKVIRKIAGIFNEKIEFRMLYVSYLCIASVKDIVKNINKARFAVYSIGIWGGYVASYIFFSKAVQKYGFCYSASDVFMELFSGSSLYNIEKGLVPFWGIYIILPLFICWLVSLVFRRKNVDNDHYKPTLPQMNQPDRLSFLRTYYEEENREHIQAYLGLNRDVIIVEDNSAGSNASTLLVMKPDGELFYRKYAFDEDGDKIQEQIDWIETHQAYIPLPAIAEKHRGINYVTYDMHSYGSVIGLFRYIHTMPVEQSWDVLKRSLDDIRTGIHSKNVRQADPATIEKYVASKVDKNIRIILEADKYIKQLEQNDMIMVNGTPLHTLGFYSQMFSIVHMRKIFSEDQYSDIHGDLTIENIVCLMDPSEINVREYEDKVIPESYYFIDPNTGNIHESPFLDYGKLLQSLHGNYEFLMMVTSVKIGNDNVNFLMMKSEAYGKMYEKYKAYLQAIFTESQMLSIYYHEVVHWLRLMPYKIRKNKKLAVVFYTGLLAVLNDVWEMENAR